MRRIGGRLDFWLAYLTEVYHQWWYGDPPDCSMDGCTSCAVFAYDDGNEYRCLYHSIQMGNPSALVVRDIDPKKDYGRDQ